MSHTNLHPCFHLQIEMLERDRFRCLKCQKAYRLDEKMSRLTQDMSVQQQATYLSIVFGDREYQSKRKKDAITETHNETTDRIIKRWRRWNLSRKGLQTNNQELDNAIAKGIQ